jgi:putative ABC transport system substrate-binding protein
LNNRRKLVMALGAGALAAPFASFAQQSGKVWRVGFLTARRRPISLDSDIFSAFSRGMRELGYVEDKNLLIEWRFSEGRAELLPVLAAELVRMKVDVIVTSGTPATRAALKATALIPIIIGSAGDPVANGLVQSLAHPGGNVTGLSNITADLSPKLLEMLLSMVPRLARVAVVLNPDNPVSIKPLENVQAAARKTGVTILSITPRTPQEIENAFSRMAREKVGGLIVTRDALFIQQVRHIAELAIKIRLPSISDFREYPEAGGLMNYGSSIDDQYWRAATYVDKILKGAKPGDLPVEQPTKFELFINRKTANALGLTIPQSLLIMADKIIE